MKSIDLRASPVRVAIVGAGFGRYALAPAFRRDARCNVVAICAGTDASAQSAAAQLGITRAYASVSEMLDAGGIDAVAVASPPHVQPDIVRRALSHRLPVFAEKLLAGSVAEAQELVDAATMSGVANMIDYIFPEIDAWRACHEQLARRDIGMVRHVVVRWMLESHDNRLGLRTWKTDGAQGGGALQHFGPHVFHYLEWLFGPIAQLSAILGRSSRNAQSADTAASLTIAFSSGATAAATLSTAAPFGSGHHIEMYGSDGSLVLSNDGADHVRGFRLFIASRAAATRREITVPCLIELPAGTDARVAPVSRLTSRFVDWITNGRSAQPDFRAGLRVQQLVDAALTSDRSGMRVTVAQAEA